MQVGSRHSVKESLCAKMSSAIIDHAADHRLHQFHFDRWQWSTVTAVFNVSVTNKMTLSFTLSEKWFSPEYMFNVASAVTGIVRQLGPPTWFWTFAPAEWTCPLHMVVEDRRTQGNAVDAFTVGGVVAANVAHGMSELIKGSITGKNYQKPWKWKNSLLSNVRTFVVRPELQKGTSRDSQGREAWHWHMLLWTDGSRENDDSSWLKARTVKEDPYTAFWVQQSQYSDKPLQEVDERETHWPLEGPLCLYYPQQSAEHGIRPHAPILLRVVKWQMDLQFVASAEDAVEYVLNRNII